MGERQTLFFPREITLFYLIERIVRRPLACSSAVSPFPVDLVSFLSFPFSSFFYRRPAGPATAPQARASRRGRLFSVNAPISGPFRLLCCPASLGATSSRGQCRINRTLLHFTTTLHFTSLLHYTSLHYYIYILNFTSLNFTSFLQYTTNLICPPRQNSNL